MGSPADAAPSGDSGRLEHPLQIGSFRVVGVLGRGGMGVVYDAIADGGKRVALKVIRGSGDNNPNNPLVLRFLREARILAQLSHPGIVRLVGHGEVDGTLYLAMERIEGVSLLGIRRRAPLDFDPLLTLAIQLTDALTHMHEAGVVHRDIKPANILIDKNGRPIITDFGISGMNEATGITRMGDLLGSPGFMAPEVTEGASPTALSDQFSLGRLLYELGALGPAKRLPKNAPLLDILKESLEIDWTRFPKGDRWPALENILRRAVASAAKERFPDCRALRAALLSLTSADLLDSDTLSEHVSSLGVKPVMSFEAESQEERLDEILRDLDRPAGEGAEANPFAEETAIDSGGARAAALVQAVRVEDPTRPPEALAPARPLPAFPTPRGAPGRPPADGGHEQTVLDLRAPLDRPAGALVSSPAEGRLLDEIIKNKLRESEVERAQPEPPEAQVPRLERQITRLKEQLHELKRKEDQPRPIIGWLVALAVAFFAGAALGWFARPSLVEAPVILIYPPNGVPLPPPAAEHKGGTPSEAAVATARGMLEAAEDHLRKRDLDGAEGLLEQCIQIADLPECHRSLGSVLALARDPAARTHFQRYLDLAPTGPDADMIRGFLESP